MSSDQALRVSHEDFGAYIDARTEAPFDWFGPLSRINVFVGATNSGKSRLIRTIARQNVHFMIAADQVEGLSVILEVCGRWISLPPELGVSYRASGAYKVENSFLREIAEILPESDFSRPHAIDGNMFHQISKAIEAILDNETLIQFDLAEDLESRYNLLRTHAAVIRLACAHYRSPDLLQPRGEYPNNVHLMVNPETEAELPPGLVNDLVRIGDALQSWVAADPPKHETSHHVYIPTLRSAMRLFEALPERSRNIDVDLLAATIVENYGLQRLDHLEVFTGNQLYATVQAEITGNVDRRERLAQFETFLSRTFFAGTVIKLIPMHRNDDPEQRLHIYIAGDGEYHLHHVGDGIQAIIILMYRLFTAKDGSWVFIEEPEINLHPGLQRIFIDAVLHHSDIRAKNLRIFMTTHSNHLLGMLIPEAEGVSVFSLQTTGEPRTFLVRTVLDRDHSPMALLGVANSSVYLASCAVWVEGITDRKYLRAYLRAYQESQSFKDEVKEGRKRLYREDIHYAFLEYAGSNLDHYLFDSIDVTPDFVPNEIKALAHANRIFLLADWDIGARPVKDEKRAVAREKKKKEKHRKLRAAAAESGDNLEYYTTTGVEIENMIPGDVLRAALPKLIKRQLRDVIKNAKINEDDYRNMHLGTYLQQVLGKHRPTGLADENGGTLKGRYKASLADIVAELVNWDNMSEPSRELALALYTFIERHNQFPAAIRFD